MPYKLDIHDPQNVDEWSERCNLLFRMRYFSLAGRSEHWSEQDKPKSLWSERKNNWSERNFFR